MHVKGTNSYTLSLGFGLAGLAALAITVAMNKAFGEAQGATEHGQQLLGSAAIVIDVAGLVLFGLAAGALLRAGHWIIGPVVALVTIACAGFSIMSVMGFVGTERLSIAKARQDQIAAVQQARDAKEQAAKERREAQERLAKSQLGFMQSEVKDASRREKKVLSKNFATGAAQIIGEIGKEQNEPKESPASPQIIIRPDAQAELISEFSGLKVQTVQITVMVYLSILLIIIKATSFPLAAFFWPRREQGAGIALAPAAAQVAVPAAAEVPQIAPPQDTTPDTPVPALAPPATKIQETAEEAAENFVEWARRTGRAGHRYWGYSIDEAYADYCAGQNRQALPPNDFRQALGSLPKRLVIKDRGKSPSGAKLTYYEIRPAPKAKAPPIDAKAEDLDGIDTPPKAPTEKAPDKGTSAAPAAPPAQPSAAAPGGGRVIVGPFEVARRGPGSSPLTGGSPLAYHLIAEVRESRAQKAMLRRECQRAQRRMNLPRREARSNRVAQRMAA